MKKLFYLILFALLSSCTDNQMAREFGGKERIEIPKNHVFINATWKDHDLWVVTVDTTNNITYFSEYSSYGILNGQITFLTN
jgi:hypothetical protein